MAQLNIVGALEEQDVVKVARDSSGNPVGLADMSGVGLISPVYTNLSDPNLPSPVGKGGLAVYLASVGMHGSTWQSDNSLYWPMNGARILLDIFADGIYYAQPDTLFTGVNAVGYDSGQGANTDTKIGGGAAVAHLLTGASVGQNLYISGGPGWAVGNHPIKSVSTAANEIILDTAYTGQGAPIIAVKNVYFPYRSIAIPPLRSHSAILCDLTAYGGGIVGLKSFKVELSSPATPTPTAFWAISNTVNTVQGTARLGIQNVNSSAVQTNYARRE